MPKITISCWEKWQTYRKDRGQPPWIKIHRCIMRNVEWIELSDAERGQLVAMWLLAADNNGVIEASPSMIRKICFMDSDPDLKFFEKLGFIEIDASVASAWRQSDAPETETETETETERSLKASMSGNPDGDGPNNKKTNQKNGFKSQAVEILNFLNEKAGRQYRPVSSNLDFIIARLMEGYEPSDFRVVIARKSREWLGDDKMMLFLRPATLFNKTKFAQYTGEIGSPVPSRRNH